MAQLIKIGIPKAQWNSDHTKNWYSDFTVNGHRVKRALSKFKPEAQRMLNEMVAVHRANKHGDIVQDMSWSYFRTVMLDEILAELDKNTFYAYRRAFDMVDETTHLTHLKQMTPDRLGRLKTTWVNSKKYTPSTIARSLQALLAAMRWAEDRKYVPMQNWRTVKSKAPAHRTDYYTRDGLLELLSKLEGDWLTSAFVMSRAGLRLGEMLHLEWEDIHFDSFQITFRSKPHLVNIENPKGWRIKKDANLNKIRNVPLFPDIQQHLYAIRKPSGFVLGPNVSRLEHGYSRQLSKALKATGVKTEAGKLGFPHLLRHTFGSHLAQIGVPIQKIGAWMGHESLRMTERYSHLSPRDTHADIQAVERLYTTFVRGQNTQQAFGVHLSTLNAELAPSDSSSEIQANS